MRVFLISSFPLVQPILSAGGKETWISSVSNVNEKSDASGGLEEQYQRSLII